MLFLKNVVSLMEWKCKWNAILRTIHTIKFGFYKILYCHLIIRGRVLFSDCNRYNYIIFSNARKWYLYFAKYYGPTISRNMSLARKVIFSILPQVLLRFNYKFILNACTIIFSEEGNISKFFFSFFCSCRKNS